MAWKITKINNKTQEVTMVDANGNTIDVVIPKIHRTYEEKSAYLDGHTSGHEKCAQIRNYRFIVSLSIIFLQSLLLFYFWLK